MKKNKLRRWLHRLNKPHRKAWKHYKSVYKAGWNKACLKAGTPEMMV